VGQIILVGTWANFCVEAYLRMLLERGFEVAVVGNATAAPIVDALWSAEQAA
jgi:nicotinamidase-related amidase